MCVYVCYVCGYVDVCVCVVCRCVDVFVCGTRKRDAYLMIQELHF